jgi:hypothetical protein
VNSTIILLGGFGRSGTTGIRELLKSHPEITSTAKSELRILTDPGGFISLKNCLVDNWTFWRGDQAIHEFIQICKDLNSKWLGGYVFANFKSEFCGNFQKANNQFLDDIVLFSYDGIWAKYANIFNKTFLRLFNHKRFKWISRKIYITTPMDYFSFIDISKNYFDKLIERKLNKEKASMFIIDEPFVSQNPRECMEITGATKLIVVLRDPRDVFVSFQGRDWSPKKKEHTLNLLRSVYSSWEYKKKHLSVENFIELKFEDIVTNFSKTYNELCKFLNVEPMENILSNTNYSTQKAHIGRWKQELSSKEQEDLNIFFAELLVQLNYR